MLAYINSSKACEMHKVSFLLIFEWCRLSWGTAAHYRHHMAAKEWISWRDAGGEQRNNICVLENMTYKEPV